jgi:hypothetical protein
MVLRRAVEDRRLNFGSFGIFSIFSRSESGVDKDFANSCKEALTRTWLVSCFLVLYAFR